MGFGLYLQKPRWRRIPLLPVIVGGLDDQWVTDLVEVQPLAKYNQGTRYLLMVLDVLFKYAWVEPLQAKTGVALVKAFDNIVRQGRNPSLANGSRQRMLQLDVSTVSGPTWCSTFFHPWGCQSRGGRTF